MSLVNAAGEVVEAFGVTDEHPFWTQEKGWMQTDELQIGDQLVLQDGTQLAVQSVVLGTEKQATYNFAVADFRTYFVGASGVWVHNTSDCDRVLERANKPDFIVSPKGTTMATNKDLNLVNSHKKGGDWFQIHNKHTDAKVNGSPHTHYPKQHGRSRTREIKKTDGTDLDYANRALRNRTMRERRNRGDKGG